MYQIYPGMIGNSPSGRARVTISQREPPLIDGLFQPLGTFEFSGNARVIVDTGNTNGYVIIDAVQFQRVD